MKSAAIIAKKISDEIGSSGKITECAISDLSLLVGMFLSQLDPGLQHGSIGEEEKYAHLELAGRSGNRDRFRSLFKDLFDQGGSDNQTLYNLLCLASYMNNQGELSTPEDRFFVKNLYIQKFGGDFWQDMLNRLKSAKLEFRD